MPLDYLPYSPPDPTRGNSPAVRAGDFIFVSGQVPMNAQGEIVLGGIEAQTRQVMENIKAILGRLGASFDDVCKSTCFLDDPRDARAFSRIYMSYFPGGLPARSLVQAKLLIDAKLEVEVVVYQPQPDSRADASSQDNRKQAP